MSARASRSCPTIVIQNYLGDVLRWRHEQDARASEGTFAQLSREMLWSGAGVIPARIANPRDRGIYLKYLSKRVFRKYPTIMKIILSTYLLVKNEMMPL